MLLRVLWREARPRPFAPAAPAQPLRLRFASLPFLSSFKPVNGPTTTSVPQNARCNPLLTRTWPIIRYGGHMSTITDTDLSTRVGRAVKVRREQLALTLRALASRSGVSSSMISDIERGEKSPTISTLSTLAAALGTPMSALIERPITTRRIQVVRGSKRNSRIDRASGARRQTFGPAVTGSKVEFMSYAVPPHTTAGPFPAHAAGTIEH